MAGWISWQRDTFSHWLFNEKRVFSKLEAWLYLLSNANFAAAVILFNGKPLRIERGSMVTSIQKITRDWGWSNNKVKRFLNLLQSEEMISYRSDNSKTEITITNYNKYQSGRTPKASPEHRENIEKTRLKHNQRTAEAPPMHSQCTTEALPIHSQCIAEAPPTHSQCTTEAPPTHTNNKNYKYNKNNQENKETERLPAAPARDRKKYGEFGNVLLNDEEYEKLVSRLGQPQTADYIENLSRYSASSGKAYKNHCATILTWSGKDKAALSAAAPGTAPPRSRSKYQNYEPRVWDYERIERLAAERL